MLQADTVKHLQNRPAGFRIAEGTEDAGKISKVFQTMSILCDVFQVGLQTMGLTCTLITPSDGHTAGHRENFTGN